MSQADSEQARRRDETEEERLDRNLMELMQELRVVLVGIQVTFAFLLIVPFQQGWTSVTDFEKVVYFVTLLLTTAASACLIAPTVRHRIRFGDLDKRWVVTSSNRLAIAGMVFEAAAICGVLLLLTDVVYGSPLTAVVTAVSGLAIAWLWFCAPILREIRDRD